MLVGWYDDAYRRTADGWRFSAPRPRRLYAGAPDLSGQFFGPDVRADLLTGHGIKFLSPADRRER